MSSAFIRAGLGRYLRVACPGIEKLPSQPFILAANHLSYLDPVLLCAYVMGHTQALLSPAATKGLFVGPGSMVLKRMGAFAIDRRDSRNLSVVREILKALRSRSVLIFPEGGIIIKPDQPPAGVGYLAAKACVPVVPVFIDGTDAALPVGGKWVRKKRVVLRFGDAMVRDDQSPETFTEEVMRAIHRLGSENVLN